jgi:hypothetical protein
MFDAFSPFELMGIGFALGVAFTFASFRLAGSLNRAAGRNEEKDSFSRKNR